MVDGRVEALQIGPALYVGAADAGQPHGTGELILPNGSVHKGTFAKGRASGPGVLYDASGAVMTGNWVDNKRVGAFITVDPKGGEWYDAYDENGKRVSRKKRAPPPADAQGAVLCGHCGVKFHAAQNSRCRQHSGKWMQASGSDAEEGGCSSGEFPDGGVWMCCGSKVKAGREGCTLGTHAPVDAVPRVEEVRLSHDENGEVVISSVRRRAAGPASAPRPPPSDPNWRAAARHCVLHEQPFLHEDSLVWLDVDKHCTLAPLASLAECGKTGCACTRTLYPRVRTRFREEVVRRAVAARAAGALPATGRLSYVSLGAGHLLADLDLVCGLEEQGFTVEAAALIDTAYPEQSARALAEFAAYLEPEGRVAAYASAAEYAAARVRGDEKAAHVFVQVWVDADSPVPPSPRPRPPTASPRPVTRTLASPSTRPLTLALSPSPSHPRPRLALASPPCRWTPTRSSKTRPSPSPPSPSPLPASAFASPTATTPPKCP